jgi:hypothetical protein
MEIVHHNSHSGNHTYINERGNLIFTLKITHSLSRSSTANASNFMYHIILFIEVFYVSFILYISIQVYIKR